MESHLLYQFDSCPFCARVRSFLREHELSLPMKDTQRDASAYRELVEGGGSGMVPCLRIERDGEVRWLYESLDIIEYLRQRLLPERKVTSG
jgi:glutathione S-transferase